jgi:hypothetical protein
MAIDKSGQWWVGSDADDLKEYLEAYSSNSYPIDHFRLGCCKCGCFDFKLHASDRDGVALRTCVKCGQAHLICDSQEFWEEAHPEQWCCTECESEICNVGVGFSLYEDHQDIRWLYVGVRCAQCGVLGCFAGWKVGYGPSLQLMDQV